MSCFHCSTERDTSEQLAGAELYSILREACSEACLASAGCVCSCDWRVTQQCLRFCACLQALEIFDIVRSNWSDAAVFSSTFDNYTAALIDRLPYLNLPVFTEEIGDTWIYGEMCLSCSPPHMHV